MPPEVQVWSAGSSPTSVRPEAIAVLQEIGIDISNHRSQSISEIPASEVDTVITLCILGTGCAKCIKLTENAGKAAEEADVAYEIEKVTDIRKIMAFGVMTTPAPWIL